MPVLCLLLVLSSLVGCADPRYWVDVVGPNNVIRARVSVEIANTPEQRTLGLMYRHTLAEDAGMLFVFKAPARVSFWMKNTLIPLDIIFADADGKIIGIVRNAEPLSERWLSVDGLSKYVLEVNAGFCARHGIVPGDRLEFAGFKPEAQS